MPLFIPPPNQTRPSILTKPIMTLQWAGGVKPLQREVPAGSRQTFFGRKSTKLRLRNNNPRLHQSRKSTLRLIATRPDENTRPRVRPNALDLAILHIDIDDTARPRSFGKHAVEARSRYIGDSRKRFAASSTNNSTNWIPRRKTGSRAAWLR